MLVLMFILDFIRGSQIGMAWTRGVHSLLGNLALPAQSIDFQRTAQQCELPQVGYTLEKLVHIGYLDVMYPPASDAKDMVMRLHVAVITRNIVQERNLARLSHFAKLLQNPMDGGQRYMRMLVTYCCTDFVAARMVLRSQQGPYHRQPLGCDGNTPLTTTRDELAESLS
jgi:hypothetical protein